MTDKLKIGLLLESFEVPHWQYRIIEDIQASGFAEIGMLVLNDKPPAPEMTWQQKWQHRWKDFARKGLFNRYLQWDYDRFKSDYDAFEKKDVRDFVSADLAIKAKPIQKKFTDRFEADDIQAIREANLDVMLRFGFRIIRGEILDVAKYGVWSFHHGDNREYRGGPALFWEIYEQNPCSGVILQVLSDKLDGGRVLYRSRASTEPNSLYLNRNPVYWKGAEFVMRRLRDLHSLGWEYLESLEIYNEEDTYDRGIYRAPTNAQMATFLTRRFMTGVKTRLRETFFGDRDHQWFCAYRRKNNEKWKMLDPPADRFYADPFLIERDGKEYLFIEEYPFENKKGVISVSEIDAEGIASEPRVVLEHECHLSYPFVFEHDDEVYMVPETCGAGQVQLFRAAEFPDKWELDHVLIDGISAVDATLMQHDGKWWLFCNVPVKGASSWDELHLYFADDLKGEWKSHPRNPIVSDVCSARPAGKLFYRDGKLIRPAQDCSKCYGYAVTLNEVLAISETSYREREIEKITPDWMPRNLGTHTLSVSDNYEVRDGKFPFRKPLFGFG